MKNLLIQIIFHLIKISDLIQSLRHLNAKISVLTFIKCPHVACTSNLVKKKNTRQAWLHKWYIWVHDGACRSFLDAHFFVVIHLHFPFCAIWIFRILFTYSKNVGIQFSYKVIFFLWRYICMYHKNDVSFVGFIMSCHILRYFLEIKSSARLMKALSCFLAQQFFLTCFCKDFSDFLKHIQ